MDFYLKIATELQKFFKEDLIDLPPTMAGKILRVEVQIATLEPLSWLARQQADVKTYWSDRQGGFAMAGVGALKTIAGDIPIDYATIFGQLRQNLSAYFREFATMVGSVLVNSKRSIRVGNYLAIIDLSYRDSSYGRMEFDTFLPVIFDAIGSRRI